MKFGPAEMAQMMDGAKALITVTMVSSVGIGLVLSVIVALFVAFFRGRVHRDRAGPHLTNGQLLTPNSSPGQSTVNPGRPPSMCDQRAREHTSIGNDIIPDNRITRSDERVLRFRWSILLLIVAFGGRRSLRAICLAKIGHPAKAGPAATSSVYGNLYHAGHFTA